MALPTDYMERVYAGVLGKIIGVYLGRPFEGWHYEPIMEHLGEINYYVHERFGAPLIVPDDDISGTFTFLRTLPDYGHDVGVTAEQIGQTWLNYLIEGRTVLWWGGLCNSTEHTAWLRLNSGIPAPMSGSIATNGKVVAEQIGSQIFIDGWAMVSPGDPEQAASLGAARRQRQPRWRGAVWRAGAGGDGGAGLCGERPQRVAGHGRRLHSGRFGHRAHDQRHSRMARGCGRLAWRA